MFKHAVILIFSVVLNVSCSQTVKGPVSGKKYNVNVGGYQDKVEYDKARKEATKQVDQDCRIVDCPEPVKEVAPY